MVRVTAGNIVLIGLATAGANIAGVALVSNFAPISLTETQRLALSVATNAILTTLLLALVLKNR